MRQFVPLAFCALLAALAKGACADDPDPIRAKLDAAKSTFDAERAKFPDAVNSHFDTREAAARKDGDKKLLDDIRIERKRFEEKGQLPSSTPAAVRQQMLTAVDRYEAAYQLAIKEYSVVIKDDKLYFEYVSTGTGRTGKGILVLEKKPR